MPLYGLSKLNKLGLMAITGLPVNCFRCLSSHSYTVTFLECVSRCESAGWRECAFK